MSPASTSSVPAAAGSPPFLPALHSVVFAVTMLALAAAAGFFLSGFLLGNHLAPPMWSVMGMGTCLVLSLHGIAALFAFRFFFDLD